MLATRRQTLVGKGCLVSGSGKVALSTAEKLIELGAKVLTLSDSSGYLFDEAGIDRGRLEYVKELKNLRHGRLAEYVERYPGAVYTPVAPAREFNPLWNHRADCAFPCATENEISGRDARHLLANGIALLCEGANMPATAEALHLFLASDILYGPGKAANAGGVAVSALEMAQNSMRQQWSREEVDGRLRQIMQAIHRTCLEAAAEYGQPGNYEAGANIAAFVKMARAMLDQGLV
jgi:glutamate dehydrogenase (NADP+)